jgi:hypothetical protein
MTLQIKLCPLILCQVFSASMANFKTMVSIANLEPQPFVRFVRSLTVAKVDSIGFVDRI